MPHDTRLFTVGELASRTGLTARTVRFYSDAGLVPPTRRTPGGYRLYDLEALERLELIRTLRELGIGLPAIGQVLTRQVSLREITATHVAALDARLRTLRLQRVVLQAVADRGSNPEELQLMHRLAKLSAAERQRIISDFWDQACAAQDLPPDAERQLRAATPTLPDDPTAEQIEAWIELAELVGDPHFRGRIRDIVGRLAATPPADVVMPTESEAQAMEDALVLAREAAAEQLDPRSARARAILDQVVAAYAYAPGQADGPEFRTKLADRLEARTDADVERYWHLTTVINGGPRRPLTTPAVRWIIAALR